MKCCEKQKRTNRQQAVCCNAGRMPAESTVGLSSVHARANICETPHYSKPPDVSGNAKKNTNSTI